MALTKTGMTGKDLLFKALGVTLVIEFCAGLADYGLPDLSC